MLRHIVIYKLNDVGPDMLLKVRDTFMSMKGKIECLLDIQCGWNVYESARSYDFALECTFKDLDGLKEYLVHPVHLPVKEFIHTVAESSKSVDYEF